MKWLKTTKIVLAWVVSAGVHNVVSNAIKSTTPKDLKPVSKALVGIGAFVIGGMVADAATKYVITEVDNLVFEIEKARLEREATKEESNGESTITI
jgi:hypothetical protein